MNSDRHGVGVRREALEVVPKPLVQQRVPGDQLGEAVPLVEARRLALEQVLRIRICAFALPYIRNVSIDCFS